MWAVTPEEGYGQRTRPPQQVAREQFEGVENLELGMQFQVDSSEGAMVITIVEIAEEMVTATATIRWPA